MRVKRKETEMCSVEPAKLCEDCETAGLRWQRERDELRERLRQSETATNVCSAIIGVMLIFWLATH